MEENTKNGVVTELTLILWGLESAVEDGLGLMGKVFELRREWATLRELKESQWRKKTRGKEKEPGKEDKAANT